VDDIEFETLLWENGNDLSTAPFGKEYADHAVLMVDGIRVVELKRVTVDNWATFEVRGSDLALTPDDEERLGGFTQLENALAFAKGWYRRRASQ